MNVRRHDAEYPVSEWIHITSHSETDSSENLKVCVELGDNFGYQVSKTDELMSALASHFWQFAT